MESMRFANKVAVITGAAAGIGHAIATLWAKEGGKAVVADKDGEGLQKLAQAYPDGLYPCRADVTSLDDIKTMVAKAPQVFGGLDVLFNVAGTNMFKTVEEAEDEEWRFIVDINLMSVYRASKYAIPEMRKRGGGSIVNVASTAGILAENRCSAYSATKAAVIMLSRNMAMDFAKDHIRVNALCPGGTLTPRIAGYLSRYPDHENMMTDLVPMKRLGKPEEIAKTALFLASDDASYVTGAALVVDGGMTAGLRFKIFDEKF